MRLLESNEKTQGEGVYLYKYDTALIKHIKPKLGGCFPMGITTGLIDGFTEERGTGS